MRKLTYTLLAAALFPACVDGYRVPEKQAGGFVDVMFTVTLPEQIDTPVRAAWSDADVENIDLLLFDATTGLFVDRVKVDAVEDAGNGGKRFTARLNESGVSRIIHFVANARTQDGVDRVDFSVVNSAMTENVAMPLLRTFDMAVASEERIMPLVMWGRAMVDNITSETAVGGVCLLRSQARIMLGVDPAVAAEGFEITSATLHGAMSSGRVAPGAAINSNQTPSTPDPAGAPMNWGDYYTSTGTAPVLYLYERENSAVDCMSLIIQGRWKGVVGYYKVLLRNDSEELLHIVRNHNYRVTVVRASGVGRPTVQEALDDDASANLHAIVDDHDGLHFIYADGVSELAVSDNVLNLYGDPMGNIGEIAVVFATNSGSLTATTDVPGLSVVLGPASAGIRTLTGNWTGSATNAAGTITLTDGRLLHTIYVAMFPQLWTNGSTAQYFRLLGADNAPWKAEIVVKNGNSYLLTHAGASTQYTSGPVILESGGNGDDLFIVKRRGDTAAGTTVKAGYMANGNFMSGRFVIDF